MPPWSGAVAAAWIKVASCASLGAGSPSSTALRRVSRKARAGSFEVESFVEGELITPDIAHVARLAPHADRRVAASLEVVALELAEQRHAIDAQPSRRLAAVAATRVEHVLDDAALVRVHAHLQRHVARARR